MVKMTWTMRAEQLNRECHFGPCIASLRTETGQDDCTRHSNWGENQSHFHDSN